jgi:hypothetical protein
VRYFDYEQVAREAKIPPDQLAALGTLVRQEFPWDDMMYELHLLRVCTAIRDGHVTLEQALKAEPRMQA